MMERMDQRHEFVENMDRALDKLQVRERLAALPRTEENRDLLRRFDHLNRTLTALREDSHGDWWAMRGGLLVEWEEFRARFEMAIDAQNG